MPAAAEDDGAIRATLRTDAEIVKVRAIARHARTLTTSKGRTKDIGIYGKPYPGSLEGDRLTVDNLPLPGTFDLQLITADGAIIEGWDAAVPRSDYVEPYPIEKDDIRTIRKKLADEQFSAFSDDMRVLDIVGNVQHAAVLVMRVRTRPFVGGGYKRGEWVWRVDRFRWDDPHEHTWVPNRERPFYALHRERLYEKQFRAKSHVFARHLGGVRLDADAKRVDLGAVAVPEPAGGVYAVDPEGQPVPRRVLKGPAVKMPEPGEAPKDEKKEPSP
jgi:hypothetical protein